jgi:hypothetical protein
MELVAVGLSHNPHYTAAEKHAHIAWYADYFKDKLHFVDDALAGEKSTSGTVKRSQ